MPKTGTTAIQSTLQKFFSKGKLDKFDMQFHSSDIRNSINHFFYTKDEEYFIKRTHKKIRKYSKIGAKNVIYSSEYIAATFEQNNKGVVFELLPVLARAFKDYNTKIIIYIRRQDILIESLLNQHIKGGRYATYDNTNFYYKELIDRCSECFDGEIIVRKYERESLFQNDAVIDFLHTIGLDELIEDYNKNKGKDRNPSLSLSQCRIAAINNKQYVLDDAEIKSKVEIVENQYKNGELSRSAYIAFMYDYLRGLDKSKFPKKSFITQRDMLKSNNSFFYKSSDHTLISAEERNKIMTQYAEDNAAVAREYFGSVDGKLFNDKIPNEVIDINEEPSVTDVIQTFMPILINLSQRCERLEKPLFQRFLLDRKKFGAKIWEKTRLKYEHLFGEK